MAGTLAPVPVQTFTDTNGRPIAGAKLYSFLAGTSTPTPVYSDVNLTVPLSNPAVADSAGRLTYYLAPTSYKLELRTALDVTVWIRDNVPATPPNEIDLDIQGVAGEVLVARQIVFLSQGTGGTTVGTWYRTDADDVDRSTGARVVGIATTGIGVGAQGAIRVQGRVTGFTSLTPGASYYISETAGAITAVAPTNARFIGIADTTTSLVLTVSAVAQALPSSPVFDTVQTTSTAAGSVVIGGGVQAGTGSVQVVGTDGRIPAIDSSRFANLSGANVTSLNGSNITSGTVPDGRLSSNVALINGTPTITGTWLFAGAAPGLAVKAPVGAAIALRLIGRTGDSVAIIDFANENQSAQYVAVRADPAGLTIHAPGAGGGVITLGTPLTPTRINSGSMQPGFLVYLAADTPYTGGATIAFGTVVYDTGSNVGGGIFTAPVTGVYHLEAQVVLSNNSGSIQLVTPSLRLRSGIGQVNADGVSVSAYVTLAAGQSAYVQLSSGSYTVSGLSAGAVQSWFSGRLVP